MLRRHILRSDILRCQLLWPRTIGRSFLSTSISSKSPPNSSSDVEYEAETARAAIKSSTFFTSTSIPVVDKSLTDLLVPGHGSPAGDDVEGSPLSQETFNSLLEQVEHASNTRPVSKAAKQAIKKAKTEAKQARKVAKSQKKNEAKVKKVVRQMRKLSIAKGREKLQKQLLMLGADAAGLIRQAEAAVTEDPNQEKEDASVEAKDTAAPSKGGRKKSITTRRSKSKDDDEDTSDVPAQRRLWSDKKLVAAKLAVESIDRDHPPVKKLSYGLESVLFKQGAYNLQDNRTGVYNFDQYLQNIMPAEEFDFDSLGAFITSSKDNTLKDLAKTNGKRYVGSTSSMTSALLHFHFLLSDFRPLNFARVSSGFPSPLKTFTEFTRLPSALYLRYQDGVYALDSDKTFDRGTILSQLGQSLEKLLLLPQAEYEQYRLSNPEKVPEEVKNTPEAYHYSTLGNLVFRSQLDGHHDWLPGTGIFDVKTRACVSVRMNQERYKEMSGYQIRDLYGEWESYEREYVDMLRSTMLKYSLQVRMGRMDGIFVAFHNTEQIFGFQYIPLSEMDLAIHGQTDLALGDQEFKLSMQMFSDVLDQVTKELPEQSLRLHFETRPRASKSPMMYIFAEPMDDEAINSTKAAEIVMGMKGLREGLAAGGSAATGSRESVSTVETEDIVNQVQEDDTMHNTSLGTETNEAYSRNELVREHEPSQETASMLQAKDEEILDHLAQVQSSTSNNDVSLPDNISKESHQNEESSADMESKTSAINTTGPEDTENAALKNALEKPKQDEVSTNGSTVANSTQTPLCAYVLETKHYVDGKEADTVANINYVDQWPLLQEQYRNAKGPIVPPAVNKSWSVEYNLVKLSDERGRKKYSECKDRRRRKFEKLAATDDDQHGFFLNVIRKWTERGLAAKKEAEKKFQGRIKKQIKR